jgi:enoyl-CoA hydratase
VATRLTKAALGSGGPETFESALAWEAIAQPVTLAMEDLQEGIAAAQDKRPPRFTGR